MSFDSYHDDCHCGEQKSHAFMHRSNSQDNKTMSFYLASNSLDYIMLIVIFGEQKKLRFSGALGHGRKWHENVDKTRR
jgi:hypothetical protein